VGINDKLNKREITRKERFCRGI